MKREKAISNITEIRKRLCEWNGVIETPHGRMPRVVVKNIWIFGSVLTGQKEINGLDVLVDWKISGERRTLAQLEEIYGHGKVRASKFRPTYPRRSADEAWALVRKGMNKLIFHEYCDDPKLAFIFDQRRMIWPEFEFDPAEVLPPKKKVDLNLLGIDWLD